MDYISNVNDRNTFAELSNQSICDVLVHLGRISCAGSSTLKAERRDPSVFRCVNCDDDLTMLSTPCAFSKPGSDEISETMQNIILRLPESFKVQTAAMSALRRLIMHEIHEKNLEISNSLYGQWCLSSMRSSSRELRIAAR